MNQNQAITPFAMRCTQEQFESVEDELNQMGYDTILAVNFTTFPYLTIWTDKIITSKCREFLVNMNTPIHEAWDKPLFLKMAGKPDPESRELIGYKINPDFDLSYGDLEGLLRCEFYDMHNDIWELKDCEGQGSEFFVRAVELGIVGEGKWLIPVYREEENSTATNPLTTVNFGNPIDESWQATLLNEKNLDWLPPVVRGTYEQQKGDIPCGQ